MEKIKLYERTAASSKFQQDARENLKTLNSLLGLYSVMDLSEMDDIIDFRKIIETEDLEGCIRNILVSQIEDKNSNIDYYQIVKLPARYSEFENAVRKLITHWRYRSFDWSLYKLIKGRAVINPKALKQELEKFTVYAESEYEIKLYKFAEKLASFYNDIEQSGIKIYNLKNYIREIDGKWEVYKFALKPESRILSEERYTRNSKPEPGVSTSD
ncbi:hypothetical protein ACFLU5_17765, partial [Bacteroidota bacterium]